MIVYIYNIGVDLYNGFNGLRHRINWTYFTVLDGLAHPLYSPDRFEYSEQEIVDGSYTKNSITLLVDSRTKSIKDYKSVMIHEIGHVIDLKYKYSSTEEFKQLYEENKIGYYDLGIHNTNEFFCEALSLYYTNPNELKNWNGDVYQYIQRLR